VRRRTTISATLVVAVVASLITSPALAVAGAAKLPPAPVTRSIPHTDVSMTAHAQAPAPAITKPVDATLPASGDADVVLPGSGQVTTMKSQAATVIRAGNLPVVVGHRNTAASGQRAIASGTPIHVHVADPAAGRAAGVSGVLFSVSDPQHSADLSVGVDYSSFRNAGGADFGDRLHLVQLPACALTTPTVPACQVQASLPSSHNDANAGTVTADAPAQTTAAHPNAAGSSEAAAPLVFAAAAGDSGPTGTFAASSLSPSGSWSEAGATGGFTWSYPINVPPAASGAVGPKVALSYDSSSVDGRTAGTNNQVSWIGEGWDYSPGFIERTYRSCSDDTTLPAASQTGDSCWAGQVVSMNLGGSTTPLVLDDASGATENWHPASDNGARVERLEGAPNGARKGEYWKVTTVDGIQYFFGRTAGPGQSTQPSTNSTWTLPVYGAHAGDPCYSTSGFAASSCNQAWRWNLDYVEDPHGNVTTYNYKTETNFYGQNGSTTGTAYIRGGYLDHIDYGLRDENGTIYAKPAPDQVQFATFERCDPSGAITCDPSQFTAANKASWPDTPQDQQCLSGAVCNNHGPSFWTTKRLNAITTQYYNGTGYTKVDAYALKQTFSTSGDPSLWLTSLTRTGYAADGSSVAMPPMSFGGKVLDNRVAGYNNQPPMARWRLVKIINETGEVTLVTYTDPDCTATSVPADPSQDTRLCFPVYWTLPFQNTPTLDYFHTYLTKSVQLQDPHNVSPSQLTSYTYVGSPAWHYDDNETVKPANRTYGQFRGYSEVDVSVGDPAQTPSGAPDVQTLTKTTYFRGMNGDTLPGGGTRAATVADSLTESVSDDNAYADTPREIQQYNGLNGVRLSSAIVDPGTVAVTARRARTGLPALTAAIVQPNKSRSITDLAAGGTRLTTLSSRFDLDGRVTSQTDSGPGVPDVCTSITYADNKTSWIRNRVSETITSKESCPITGPTPSLILTDVRTFFDGQTTLGSITGAGDTTRTDAASANASGTLTFQTTKQSTFDSSGRQASTTDALSHTTTIAYTPVDGGSLTQTVATNPLGQRSSVTVDPGRASATATIDVAGHRTDTVYDQLGRLTAQWLPGHDKTAGQLASVTYSYLLSPAAPEAVTTKTLIHTGTSESYTTTVKIYDAYGQLKQTQSSAEGGGRIASDVFYDSHGWTISTNDRYNTDGDPATTLIAVAPVDVNSRTVSTHDGSGRVVDTTSFNGLTSTWDTRTVYGGDRTTTIPPQGGVTTTSVTDIRGKTVETRDYTSAPTVSGNVVSSGTYQSTLLGYTPTGQQNQITDPDGHIWNQTYDLLGRKTQAQDPATGTSNYTYDAAGQLQTSTDARGQTLAYDYDSLGRKTTEYKDSLTGPKLASWAYDTVQVGKPSSSTRYTSNGNYLIGYGGYDGEGNLTKELVQVPASDTGVNGTYTTQYEFDDTNRLGAMHPAREGGLADEWIGTDYDALGNPKTISGSNAYVDNATYTPYGEPQQYALGVNQSSASLTFDHDPQTRRVNHVTFSGQTANAQIDDSRYAFDAAGNPTRSVDSEGTLGTQTQCFGYDNLDRLADAWTASDNCAAAPSTSVIAGVAPYWSTWKYDPTGLRTSQVQHVLPGATGGDTTTSYTYPAATASQPSALASTSTTGPTGTTSTAYTYNAEGDTQTRSLASGTQTLTWDEENHLATDTGSAGATSYVYDADGHVLVRHDPGSSTLYLPGEELTYNAGTKAVTGTRYYAFNGQNIAERVGGADPVFLDGDPHGTMQTVYTPSTGAVTRRPMDPYGNPVGPTTNTTAAGVTSAGTWPDSHGFLGKSVDQATGLTDVGAREYDSSIGRFESVDPVLNPADQSSVNGYGYADDNPVAQSDPSGACPIDKCGLGTVNNGTLANYGPLDPGNPDDKVWVKPGDFGAGSYSRNHWPTDDRVQGAIDNARNLAHSAAIAYLRQEQAAVDRQIAREKALENSSSRAYGEYPENHKPVYEDSTGLLLAILGVALAFIPGVGEVADAGLLSLEAGAGLAGASAEGAAVEDQIAQQQLSEDELMQRANAARDQEVERLAAGAAKQRSENSVAVGAYNVETGEVAAGVSSKLLQECAEACAARNVGGDLSDIRFTRALRPRGSDRVPSDQPVCAAYCEPTYGRNAFPDPNTTFQSDGY
jgi:RHS repeat-associated protein